MRKHLSPEEFNVLTVLGEAFPEKLHLQQLAPRTTLSTDHAMLLRILDALIVRGLIECTPLRGSEGLVDAANILISNAGNNLLDQLDQSNLDKVSSHNAGLQPIKATILNILIASPSDVSAERNAVVGAIHDWNASNHTQIGIMLNPVRWETHSYPATGDRPQAILNRQIVDSGHLLIGIFGNRLGTPTGESQSGTIEEIEQFRQTGRHVALYFSTAPVPRNADRDQLEALERYKQDRQRDTLYCEFATAEDLQRLVTQHLPKIVSEVYDGLQRAKPKAFSPDHGFQLMAQSYLDVQMYRDKWKKNAPIESVTMVHVNGGVFRQQRTDWQIVCANKIWPPNLAEAGDVEAETPDEMNRRLKIELEGPEPWPDTLVNLRVFIGNANKFERWKVNKRPMETQEASRLFWIGYLRKLKELYGRDRRFVAELYEIEYSPFYAHIFNSATGGHIVGCNLIGDLDLPKAYQVLWPTSQDKPTAFDSIEREIERIKHDSTICKPIGL